MSPPHDALLLWILIPPETIRDPSRCNDVGRAVVVDVYRPFTAVGDKFSSGTHCAPLVSLPIASVGAGILIPIRTADKVEISIAVHIQSGDALGVVVAQSMYQETTFGLSTVDPSAGVLHAYLMLRTQHSGKKQCGQKEPTAHEESPPCIHCGSGCRVTVRPVAAEVLAASSICMTTMFVSRADKSP